MDQQRQTHPQHSSPKRQTPSQENSIQQSQVPLDEISAQVDSIDDILADYIVAPTEVITENDQRPELRPISAEKFINQFRQEVGQ